MFGQVKESKLTTDMAAELMLIFGWHVELSEFEKNIFESAEVDPQVYSVEILCLAIYLTVFTFQLWASQSGSEAEWHDEVMNKFHIRLAEQCKEYSQSGDFYRFILQRFVKYGNAWEIDAAKIKQGWIGVELYCTFAESLMESSKNLTLESVLPEANIYVQYLRETIIMNLNGGFDFVINGAND